MWHRRLVVKDVGSATRAPIAGIPRAHRRRFCFYSVQLDGGFLKDLDNGYRLRPMIEGPTRGLESTNGTDTP